MDYSSEKVETLMFYNVENLFPPDQKVAHDLDPTPSGLHHWDQKRYDNKIKKLAHVVELLVEENRKLPLLIGLAEISTDTDLENIIKEPIFENFFQYIHFDSLDERGMDVALLFDSSKCEIIHAEPISFIFEFAHPGNSSFDTTRDVLFCQIRFYSEILDIYVLHLPSKRDKNINKPKRDYILSQIKEKILAERGSGNPVIILGDFNENPNAESITNFCIDNSQEKFLLNPFQKIFENKTYSTYHHNEGLLFDQILVSRDFFSPKRTWQFLEAKVFNHIKLGSWDRKFHGRPFRTYAGKRYLGGYSDHFPVFIKLIKHQ